MKKRSRSASKRSTRRDSPSFTPSTGWVVYILLAAGLALTLFVRLRYLQLPLERDEGEFGYVAQRISSGLSPFEAYNYKLPGVPCVYTVFMALFGQTISAIHLALLAANLGTSLLLFFGFRKLFGNASAAIAAVVYSLLSLDLTVLGTAAHATQFVNLFMVAGVIFLLREKRTFGNSLGAGVMMGLSFIMKQPAFLLILYGGALLLWFQLVRIPRSWCKALSYLGVYVAGACLPYLMIVLAALRFNQFDLFWKWTSTYPTYYISVLGPYQGWENFKIIFGEIVRSYPVLYLAGAIGFIALLSAGSKGLAYRFAIPALLTVSIVMIIPGFYFHHHYFILLFPAFSLCVASGFELIKRLIAKYTAVPEMLALALFTVIAAAGIISQRDFYFRYSTDDYSRIRYVQNPFREAIPVADYVRSITSENDKILVVGSEAEIYFYAKRAAASGYLFVHAMVSNQPKNLEMQREFIAEAERSSPEAMVLCGVQFSWLKQPGTPDLVLRWFEEYSRANYQVAGIADMLDQGTVYKWGEAASSYIPQADNYLIVYKRKRL